MLAHVHLDHLGSVIARTSAAGYHARMVRYRAYGEETHYQPPATVIQPDDSDRLVDAFGRHDNLVGYFAGHTHRHRVRRFDRARRVPFGEIGATKDFPGAWAEYHFYEGGYTQVARRVAAPDAFAWAEKTRAMYEGAYGIYALGDLTDRCFTQLY